MCFVLISVFDVAAAAGNGEEPSRDAAEQQPVEEVGSPPGRPPGDDGRGQKTEARNASTGTGVNEPETGGSE